MSDILVIEQFPPENIKELSTLTANSAAAQAVIVVENSDQFTADSFVLVGKVGSETGEIKKILSVTGNSVTFTSNLSFAHYVNDNVYKLDSDKARIYRATNVDGEVPANGDFSLLTTLTLQGDQANLEYTDSTGSSSYWYKYTFYNSVSLVETSLSVALASRGSNYGNYTTVSAVRNEAGLKYNKWISDADIYEKLLSSMSEVNSILIRSGYTLPLDSVPDIIENATRLLAAGYMLLKDYGPEFAGTNKDGTAKIKQARDLLAQISKGDLVLVDVTTQEVVTRASSIRGYPDSTAEDQSPSEGRMFNIYDQY